MNAKIFNGTPEVVEKELNAFLTTKFKFKNAMLQRNGATNFEILQSQSVTVEPDKFATREDIEAGRTSATTVNLTVTVIWE